MQRYKVALVADWYLPRVGGLELHIRDLANQLVKRGHEAHIICVTPGPPQGAQEDRGVRLHRLPIPIMPGLNFMRGPEGLRALESIFAREGFDVVHAQSALSPLALGACLTAKRMRIPSVFTEQSVLPVWPYLLGDRAVGWCRWPQIMTGVSHHVARILTRISGRDDVEVLNNGVDPAAWRVERVPPPDHAPVITTVLRFTGRKRPFDVVRAAPRVLDRMPSGIRPRFVLFGDGPLLNDCRRLAQRLGVAEHVEMPGVQPHSVIREALARSSVFVLPSIKEAHPRAVLEALSAGLPVVARRPNGVEDSVEHGREGLLAATFDELVDGITRLARDPDLRASMGAQARTRLHRFDWDHVIPRHLDLYRRAAQRLHGTDPLHGDAQAQLRAGGQSIR
jgi:glycosyltransferase involved in cell wall biosynthesis